MPNECPQGLPDEENASRSEEHTSELQSRLHLVCRLLLEKTKTPFFTGRRPGHVRHSSKTECGSGTIPGRCQWPLTNPPTPPPPDARPRVPAKSHPRRPGP